MSLRSARVRAGKRVADVTALLGISDAAVYQWETGETRPRTAFLPRLAQFYGCSIDELLSDDVHADDTNQTVP